MLRLRIVLTLLCLLLVAVPVFAQDMMGEYTVNLSDNEALGSIMVGANGMTLYIFTRDPLDASVCSGQCLENWPALTVESGDALTADPAIPGEWGTITREDDGTTQVTYNGQPLYYWAHDEAPGDTTGQGVGGVWWVVPPATVAIANNADLGPTLVGPTGMTVYIFTNDEPGVSNCSGDCLTNWPALTVESAEALVAGVNVHGELGTITRADDGTMQVTYNGWPLYYFAQDAARGDATGEGAGERWFTLAPETLVISNTAELGDFLVAGAGGKTVYYFANDEAGVSNCSGQCIENWPAVTVGETTRLVGGVGVEGELGTITRDDGALQVTYNGMPLYFWKDDVAPGDTTGQGVGDVWFVVAP
jgi:predicted lipoprotein with Yx(FWY)xxD motif